MTITIFKEPSPYCFIGNAVTFEVQTDSYGAIVVEIISNGVSQKASYYPFKKGDIYTSRFNIAGYTSISSHTSDYPEGDPISPLSDFSIPYQVKIGEDYVFDGIAFKGGIDSQTLTVLGREDFDIFSYRLGSHFEQFLFTTRTHAKLVKLRESELYPFVFIHPGIGISFKSESGNTIIIPAQTEDSICVMDIAAVRLNYLYQFGETPHIIEVWTAGEKTFTIQIVPKQVSEESYLIRFKNSLGAYELIEVVGAASHEPQLSEPDIYQSLTGFGFYSDRRDRLSIQDIIKVETGYKTKDEILFIRDMVCSDETYFIYPDGSYFRCNVSVDKIAYQHKQVTPTSIPLIITNENDSRFVSPHLDWNSLISRAGIFDETFDDTFE
jgi:hypothetical protein